MPLRGWEPPKSTSCAKLRASVSLDSYQLPLFTDELQRSGHQLPQSSTQFLEIVHVSLSSLLRRSAFLQLSTRPVWDGTDCKTAESRRHTPDLARCTTADSASNTG